MSFTGGVGKYQEISREENEIKIFQGHLQKHNRVGKKKNIP